MSMLEQTTPVGPATAMVAAVGAVFIACAIAPAAAAEPQLGLGTPLTERDLAGWNIDVSPDGTGLPAGKGTVPEGKAVYDAKCASCHGANGEGKPANRLVGGSVRPPSAVKTVGSFWPYATTLYDYVYRAMPWDRPQSLTPEEVYSVSAYILHLNGILPESAVVDAASLTKIRMPNRDGFTTPDPRPDTR